MQENELESLIKKRANNKYNFFESDFNKIDKGIVFIYSSWSPSIVQLRNLIISLENFPKLDLYIFDINNELFLKYEHKNKICPEGWGETFWIRSGKIVATFSKYNSHNLEELIKYNLAL